MAATEYPLIKQEGNYYYVTSKNGQVLGKFGTSEGAEDFTRQYKAMKGFSSTVNEQGVDQAMEVFKQKIKKQVY